MYKLLMVLYLLYFLFCRENKLEKDIIDTTFAVEQSSFGVLKLHELKTGGRNIQLTEDNKKEYVKYDIDV